MGRRLLGRAAATCTVAFCLAAWVSATTPPAGSPVAAVQRQPVNEDARAMASLQDRVKEYLALHNKLEKTLTALPKEASPTQIDRHQRALAGLVQNARRGAKPGDVFTPDAQRVIVKLMERVFGGPDGRQLRASVMDENPGKLRITVNGRYPDDVPLSTVPPQVLAGLPRLPGELEFRFIGRRLILMDVHAHTIVDFIDNAIPA